MPVGVLEITPQTPSGVTKISVEVEGIIAETSFDAELDLAESLPVETSAESHDFTQVGHILRKMMPLEVQLDGEPVEPPSIDVELPVEKPAIIDVVPKDLPQQMGVAETKMPAKIASAEETDYEPQTAEAIPLELVGYTKIPIFMPNVAGKPSIPEISFAPKVQINAQLAEKSDAPVPDKNADTKHTIAPPQNNAPHSVKAAPPNEVSAAQPDIIGDKLPESKLQTAPAFHRDIGDFGAGISETPHAQRPRLAAPIASPNTGRPQAEATKIFSQILSAISNTSKNTVEIRLDPPELGRVTISITQSDSGLLATVTSEKPEIADLLRRHAELLSRELSKSGFNETTLEFSHHDQQQNHPAFDENKGPFSPVTLENNGVTATIETILQSHSGSLDIRL